MAEPLTVQLLGRPEVRVAGTPLPRPRGRKVWALLAYLLLTDTAPARERLAELLFADADDPLNALSWNLSQLRRLLGDDADVHGDPVELVLPPGTFVDAHALTRGTWRQSLDLPGLGSDLLEGMTFPGCAGFEVWLLAARRRYVGAAENLLREAARARLSAGDGPAAVALAARLVAANPLDEDSQELLVRGYVANGDLAAARAQRDSCIELFRRELGQEPGGALVGAADAPAQRAFPDRPPSAAMTIARLEAGQASLDAGAVDAAVDLLRQAVAEARATADPPLLVRALLALGGALVHGVRGHDGEGAAVLQEAIGVAEQAGLDGPADLASLASAAHRELGYIELLRGRYDRAQGWLRGALDLAEPNHDERAWALAVRGVAVSDTGRYDEALSLFAEAWAMAADGGKPSQLEAWAHTFSGRIHLLRGELDQARDRLARGLAVARNLRWTSFTPLPEALLAEVDLLDGDHEAAEAAYEHAHAMALQLNDPCWEGLAARGLGQVAARRGDDEAAWRWMHEARDRCVRMPDAYLWVEGYCLDSLCELALRLGRDDAQRHVDDLETLATRTGMRELVVRAYAHRRRLGAPGADEAVRVLAAEVDNPRLRDLG